MFSATFKKKVERLARVALTDPIRIVQGDVGEANEDVIQCVLILPNQAAKFTWLTGHIVQFLSAGSLLVFVTKKVSCYSKFIRNEQVTLRPFSNGAPRKRHPFSYSQINAEELSNSLKLKEFDVLLLHGDMDQVERNKVITQFKRKEVNILIATDVAGNIGRSNILSFPLRKDIGVFVTRLILILNST